MMYTTNYVTLFSILLGVLHQGNAMQKVTQITVSPFKKYLDKALYLDVTLPGNSLESTKLLLAARADVTALNSASGSTPVHYAARIGSTDLLQLLMQDRSYMGHVVDSNGATPLMMAALGGFVDCIQVLLKTRVPVDQKDLAGKTALHYAAIYGRMECVTELLQEHACIDAQTHSGTEVDRIRFGKFTPLHCAAYKGHTQVVELLIQYQADITLKTNYQETAYELARANHFRPIMLLLANETIKRVGFKLSKDVKDEENKWLVT